MKPSKMNLRARQLLAFGAVLLIMLLLSAWSSYQFRQLRSNADQIGDNWLPSIIHSSEMNTALGNLRLSYLRLTSAKNAEQQKKYAQELLKNRADFDAALRQYLPLVSSERERQLADQLQEAARRYHTDGEQLLALLNADRTDEAEQLNAGSMRKNGWAVRDLVIDIIKLNQDGAVTEGSHIKEVYRQSVLSIAAATALALLLGFGLAWRISTDLSRRIGSAARAADRCANGDLSQAIEVQGHDEVAQMLLALARMQQQLAGLVNDVRQNAESVATASAEISQGNTDLSVRTEKQASALQQTAASMEEINGAARNNADNAAQASQLAAQASGVAGEGSSVMDEVVGTMREIETASRQMEEIISVIDGIAFQTNILALNAAVEAARAGEQGRGFAVVAGEVRALAQRSAEAARQVKGLIVRSVERVEAGSTLVHKAGGTMQEVRSAVQRVSDIVGEIAAGSHEQMRGVAQVSEAVSHMDQATQQNAALVEESAAAAESLRQQADTLVRAASVFRTAQAHADAAPSPAAAPAVPRKPAVPSRLSQAPRPASAPRRTAAAVPVAAETEWAAF